MATSRGRWAAVDVTDTVMLGTPSTLANPVEYVWVIVTCGQVVVLVRSRRKDGIKRLGPIIVMVRAVADGNFAAADRRAENVVSRRLCDRGGRRSRQVATGRAIEAARSGDGGRVGRILALGPRDGEHAQIDREGDKSAKTHECDRGQRQNRATGPLVETGASNFHDIVPWQRQQALDRLVEHRLPAPD